MKTRLWGLPQPLWSPEGSAEGAAEPGAEPPTEGTETGAEGTSAAEGSEGTEGAAPAPAPAKPEPNDWRAARIAKQSAQLKELRERLETYKTAPPQAEPAAGGSAAEIERLANERAHAIAAQATFNAQCDAVATAGRKEFPDFESKVQNLVQLVDRNDQESIGAYNRFLQMVIDTGEGPGLIHRLGSVPDEAARLMGLPMGKMAVEIAKMAVAPQAQATSAPKPINPVGGRGVSHEAIDPGDPDRADKLTTRAWIERREKQLKERASA